MAQKKAEEGITRRGRTVECVCSSVGDEAGERTVVV